MVKKFGLHLGSIFCSFELHFSSANLQNQLSIFPFSYILEPKLHEKYIHKFVLLLPLFYNLFNQSSLFNQTRKDKSPSHDIYSYCHMYTSWQTFQNSKSWGINVLWLTNFTPL